MPLQRLAASLPRGGRLDDVRWRRHHRVLRWLLGVQLPVLAAAVLWRHLPALAGAPTAEQAVALTMAGGGFELALLLLLGILALLGWRLPSRQHRSLAVTLGLMLCSTLLVHVTGGIIEAHFHYFVMLGFVALYHDWRPYATAVAVVLLSHGVLGVLAPASVYNHAAGMLHPWLWAGLHTGFIALACVSQVVLWKISEGEQDRAGSYYAQLYGSERALISRLHEAERVKKELLALASHELRTPLTGIIGSARTLDRRLEDLDASQVRTLLSHIDLHARRMSRLVDNLVATAGAQDADPNAAVDLGQVVSAVVDEAARLPIAAGHELRLNVSGEVVAMIDQRAARRVASNLVDNACKFADPGSDVAVTVRRDDDVVLLEVENAGPGVPGDVRLRLGEAFAQGDSSDARRAEGMGLGLHVVRSLVNSYDGSLELWEGGGRVMLRVRLHARRQAPEQRALSTVAI